MRWERSFAGDRADRRFDPDDTVQRRRAGDRAVGLGTDRQRGEARRERGTGTRGRAAGTAVESIRICGESTDRRPSARGKGGAHVGPLREVGRTEDDEAGVAKFRDERRVAGDGTPEQRRRASGAGKSHGLDVVLDENRNAVQGTSNRSTGPFVVPEHGVLESVGGQGQDAPQFDLRSGRVDPGNSVVQRRDDVNGGRLTGGHGVSEIQRRHFTDVWTR
jgi:hypothetical protein